MSNLPSSNNQERIEATNAFQTPPVQSRRRRNYAANVTTPVRSNLIPISNFDLVSRRLDFNNLNENTNQQFLGQKRGQDDSSFNVKDAIKLSNEVLLKGLKRSRDEIDAKIQKIEDVDEHKKNYEEILALDEQHQNLRREIRTVMDLASLQDSREKKVANFDKILQLVEKQAPLVEKRNRLLAEYSNKVPVSEILLCPITKSIFEDPVTISSGHTFEREAIKTYHRDIKEICPMTREEIRVDDLEESEIYHNAILIRNLVDIERKKFPILNLKDINPLSLSALVVHRLSSHTSIESTLKFN